MLMHSRNSFAMHTLNPKSKLFIIYIFKLFLLKSMFKNHRTLDLCRFDTYNN